MQEKKLWIIDAGYMIKAQHQLGNEYFFDYKKLREKLEQTCSFWRVYYLNCTLDPPEDQQNRFHTWLQKASPDGPHFRIRLYPLKESRVSRAFCLTCGKVAELHCKRHSQLAPHTVVKRQQKGVDVGIATLILRLVDQYDTLVLSSGDRDLLDAVEHVIEHCGKRFELAVFRCGVSPDLQSCADNTIWLDEYASDIRADKPVDAALTEDEETDVAS